MVAAMTVIIGIAAAGPAAAWETNGDALRILGSRLGSDGRLFANVATLVELAGSSSEKAALATRAPTEVISPIEHLPVDQPYAALSPASRQQLTSAFGQWAAAVPALAAVLRAASRIQTWSGQARSPIAIAELDRADLGRAHSARQLHDAAVAYLENTRDARAEQLLRKRPTLARNLLLFFEQS